MRNILQVHLTELKREVGTTSPNSVMAVSGLLIIGVMNSLSKFRCFTCNFKIAE